MKRTATLCVVGLGLAFAFRGAWSAEPPGPGFGPSPYACTDCPVPPGPAIPGGRPPTEPGAEQPPAAPSDAFAQAPEAGTQAGATFNPNMFGDLVGFTARRVVTIPRT